MEKNAIFEIFAKGKVRQDKRLKNQATIDRRVKAQTAAYAERFAQNTLKDSEWPGNNEANYKEFAEGQADDGRIVWSLKNRVRSVL